MAQTLFDLDPASSVPLYRQIEHAIVAGIARGTFDTRHRLPSSRELADELEVSRNTVNLAYQDLLAQGILISQERRGIFVNVALRRDQRTAPAEAPHDPSAPPVGIAWDRRLPDPGDSALPEIVKDRDWSAYPYPFVVGQVEYHHFPARAWARCLRESLYPPHLVHSLQDAAARDDELLTEMIRTRLLPSRGVHASADEILVTIGTQHGLDLIASTLLGPGSRVLVEDPGYLDARHIVRRHHASVVPMPVDDDGAVVPDDLTGYDMILLTPSHHYPTNVTMSMPRRRAALGAAAQAGTVVVEDDYDAEFRYLGRPSPSLKALDRTGDVVHLGSFSKFLAPGLRLGFLVGPPPLISALRATRRYTIRHPPGLLQRAMALFLDSGDYHRTLRLNRDRMRQKWNLMVDGVERALPFATGPFPPGGVSLWVEGPPDLDVRRLQEAAASRGVLVERGDILSVSADDPGWTHGSAFRLGYGAVSVRSISAGIEALGDAAREVLSGAR